ncbi:MAG: Ku protein [Gemmatimonadota bacterium]|nr:Ku protein [Gemmatimonadota bacterium]
MPDAGGDVAAPRPFWSGSIAFGLVNVPVQLYSAVRGRTTSLRMLSPDGRPLRRRYVCPEEGTEVPPDQIVRGFETDTGWVVVRDDELEALRPEKSREIDLRRFVPRSELDPMRFQRAYFLLPSGDSTKAYRLLAATMEQANRAGIATFVMRGKEYLTAILAEDGILRAETLRYADELRTPADVGLALEAPAPKAASARMRDVIRRMTADTVPEDALSDHEAERLTDLAQRKARSGTDLVAAPREALAEEGEARIVDLIAVLKARLEHGAGNGVEIDQPDVRDSSSSDGHGGAPTKAELYARARELDVPGRSRMDKDALERAIAEAEAE